MERRALRLLQNSRRAFFDPTVLSGHWHEDRETSPRRMESFMARGRGGASHHGDVECAYAGLEWFLVLSKTASSPRFFGSHCSLLAPGFLSHQDIEFFSAHSANRA